MLGMSLARVPRRGERVHVDGQHGTWVVVRVDKVSNITNVELWNDPGVILRSVPFDGIQSIHATASEAA
jgi:hypothetical protein